MTVNVNPPPRLLLPQQFLKDPQTREYFRQTETIIFQLWNRSGGNNDSLSDVIDLVNDINQLITKFNSLQSIKPQLSDLTKIINSMRQSIVSRAEFGKLQAKQTINSKEIERINLLLAQYHLFNGKLKSQITTAIRRAYTPPKRERVINAITDFPEPSGGVITLEDDCNYIIGDFIDMGTTRFVWGTGTTMTANNALTLSLNYTGALPFISGQQVELKDIAINTPNATAIDLTGTSSTDYLLLNTVLFVSSDKIAVVDDIGSLNIINCGSISITTTGIEATGNTNWNDFRIDGLNLQGTANNFIGLDIRGSLLNDVKVDSMAITAATGLTGCIGIIGDANSANIETGDIASFTSGSFKGPITPVSGISPIDDIRYSFLSNAGLDDTFVAADMYLNTPVGTPMTVAIATPGVYVPADDGSGLWSSSIDSRLTVSNDGIIKNELEIAVTTELEFDATMERITGGSDQLGLRIGINDNFTAAASIASTGTSRNSRPVPTLSRGIFTLQPGDYARPGVANLTGNVDIDIYQGSKATIFRVL